MGEVNIEIVYNNLTTDILIPAMAYNIYVSNGIGQQGPAGSNWYFSNANGVTFGNVGSTVTASVFTNYQSQGNYLTTAMLSNAVTLSNINVSGGTTSQNLSAIVFSNSNGVSFGMNGSTMTASVQTNYLTTAMASNAGSNFMGTNTALTANGVSVTANSSGLSLNFPAFLSSQSNQAFSAQGGSSAFQTLNFVNTNGVSFSNSNGSIYASVNAGAAQTGISGISAGAAQATSGTVVWSNSNGVSFGMNGQTMTASVQTNYLTTAAQSNQVVNSINGSTGAMSFATGSSLSSSSNGSTITWGLASNITTALQSAGNYLTTAMASNAVTLSNINLSAGTTSQNLSKWVYSNSNGVSFGLNGSTITASIATSLTNINFSAGTTSQNLSNIIFSNSNGVSFGLNGSTVTASVGGAAAGSLSAGTTSMALGQVVFSNSNSISFGLNISTVTASFSQSNQNISLYALGNTTQNSSTVLNASNLSYNGLGAATLGFSNGSIQVSVPVQSAQTQSNIQAIYDGANSISTGTIRFTNANNVSFSINGNTISASIATSLTNINFSAGTTSQNLSNIVFSNSNNVSFGLNGSTVTGSIATSLTAVNLSAGTTSNNLSAFVFSNSNGVSFGLNGSTVTASVGGAAAGSLSAGTTTMALGQVVFSNSNGVSFGLNGSTVTATVQTNYLTTAMQSNAVTISNINLSAGTTSLNASAFTFANSNGLAFGLSGNSVLTGSYTVPTQSNQNISFYALGNTTQNSSSVIGAAAVSLNAIGSLTIGYSNGSIQFSAPNALTTAMLSNAVTLSNINLSAGTTSSNLSAFVFSNSNSISFGLNGGTVTATVSYPAQSAQTQSNIQAVYDGANSISTGTIRFTNANGVSFSINGQTVSASVAAQSNQNISLYALGNTTQNSSTVLNASNLSFNGVGNITVGFSNGSIQISQTGGGGGVVLYDGANSISTGTARFTNANGVSFTINGQTISGSVNQSVSLYALGNTTQNSSTNLANSVLSLNAIGSLTIGYSNGSIQFSAPNALTTAMQSGSQSQLWIMGNSSATIGGTNISGTVYSNGMSLSVAAPGGGGAINVSAGTTSNNLQTVVFSNSNNVSFGLNGSTITGSIPAQSNQTVGMYALGNTTQNSSSTFDARTLSYNFLGAMTGGYSNGSIQISAPNTSSISATGGLSVVQNGSTLSMGFPAPATLSRWDGMEDAFVSLNTIGQGSLSIQQVYIPYNVTATAALIAGSLSAQTNTSATTGSINLSLWMGVYTLNGSTLSLASSGSALNAFTVQHTGSTSNNTVIQGMRALTLPMNVNITPGVYYIGVVISSASTYTGAAYTVFGNNAINSAASGGFFAPIGSATSVNMGGAYLFQGIYTAATSAGPASMSNGNINMTSASNAQRANLHVQFYSNTF